METNIGVYHFFFIFILVLASWTHVVFALLSPPGSPGVCALTEEVEELHNVTVYSPCIRRIEAPCGGDPSRQRMCTHYSQQTCTRVSSRLQVKNVTHYVCCEGWHEDATGYCTIDIFPLPFNHEEATRYDNIPARDDSPTEPQKIYLEVTEEPPTTTTQTTTSEPETLPEDTTSTIQDGEGSFPLLYPETPSTTQTVWRDSITVPVVHPEETVGDGSHYIETVEDAALSSENGDTTAIIMTRERTSSTTTPSTTTTILSTSTTIKTTPTTTAETTTTSMMKPTLPFWPWYSSRSVPTREEVTTSSRIPPSNDEKDGKKKMTYNYVTIKTTIENGPINNSNNNNSLFVLHPSSVRTGLSPAIYIAMTIATVVIIVTIICCIYVFVFKDKPRAVNTREIRLNNFYLNENLYDANGSPAVPPLVNNSQRALPMPDRDTVDEFRAGTMPNGTAPRPVCNGGTPKIKKAEPPLTTSTPINRVGEKSGFAYTNPGFKRDGSDGSLSDVSEIGFPPNGNVAKKAEEEECNGGYMIPVSKRKSPSPTAPKKSKTWDDIINAKGEKDQDGAAIASGSDEELDADCVSENLENERRHEDLNSLQGGVYESIPADNIKDIVPDDSSKELKHTNSSEAHTYEEIPENMIKPGASKDAESKVSHQKQDSDTIEEIQDNVSEDLVTFMTNYLAKTGSFVDLDATYDKADMFTPQTPTDTDICKDIGADTMAIQVPELKDNVECTSSKAITSKPEETPSLIEYGTPVKIPKCDNVNEVDSELPRLDFKRASSFENIYDTVDPDAVMEEVTITPMLPPRRRVLESPVLPDMEDTKEEYSVIDLSDEIENDDSVFVTDNSGVERTQDGQATALCDSNNVNGVNNTVPECSYVTIVHDQPHDVTADGEEGETSTENSRSKKLLAGSSKDYGESDA